EKPWASLPGVQTGLLSNSITNPVIADATGANLVTYTGTDTGAMTLDGEINKLASNIAMGRDWAGIHYRSDSMQGLMLGEEVAIHVIEDLLSSMIENHWNGDIPEISIRRFDGTFKTIKPTICKCKN